MEVGEYEVTAKKTTPITFRLSENLVEGLKLEAENFHLSLNTLVKQILEKYMTWERHSNKMGLIPLTRPFLEDIINSLPDKRIMQIAGNASKEALKELVLIARGDCTLNSFISVFNEWLTVSRMIHRYEFNSNTHHYVISHNLGEKWSLYIKELLKAICEDMSQIEPSIQTRKDSISISLSEKLIS